MSVSAKGKRHGLLQCAVCGDRIQQVSFQQLAELCGCNRQNGDSRVSAFAASGWFQKHFGTVGLNRALYRLPFNADGHGAA